MPRKVAKVAIVRDERNLMVQARLGDQYVGELRFEAGFDEPRTQETRALPEPFVNAE